MAKALNAFPHLKKYCSGVHESVVSAGALSALPARDEHVREIMYGPDHDHDAHFNILDARDWRDAAGRHALELAKAGRLPAALAAGVQMLMEPIPADSAHAEWVHTPGFDDNPVFSFAGAAWLALYNLGAASALRERWDLSAPTARLCGTSSGALVAAANAVASPLSDSVVRCFEQWVECNEHVLGPWSQMDRIIHEGLHALTPTDAHTRVSHRLKVALASSIAPVQHDPGCMAARCMEPPAGDVQEEQLQLYQHPLPQAVGLVGLDAIWGEQVLPHRVHATNFATLPELFAAVRASCFLPCYSGAYAKLPRRALHTMHPAVQQQHEIDPRCTCRTPAQAQSGSQEQASVAGQAAGWWHRARPSADALRRRMPCNRPAEHACFDGAMTDNIPRWHGDEEFTLLKLVGTQRRGGDLEPHDAAPAARTDDAFDTQMRIRSRSVSRVSSLPTLDTAADCRPASANTARACTGAQAAPPATAQPVPLVIRPLPEPEGAGSPTGDGPACRQRPVPPLAVDLRDRVQHVPPSALAVGQEGDTMQWTNGAVALRSGYVFDPRTDGLTVTISPNAGAGTISPPLTTQAGSPQNNENKRRASPLARTEARPVSFNVQGNVGVGGWAGVHAVFPCPASVWWETFFAGRAHAQSWMAQHNFNARPKGQGKPSR